MLATVAVGGNQFKNHENSFNESDDDDDDGYVGASSFYEAIAA